MARRRKGRSVTGILVLDKPVGPSSNQALQRVRHLFGAAKGGHTGNLDPLASGVLPICLGEATKLSQFLLDSDKAYEAQVTFGVSTATGDSEGEVLAQKNAAHLLQENVSIALSRFVGDIQQTPPMYSALKVDGQPLYKLARQGKEVERKPRPVTIRSAELKRFSPGEAATADIDVVCSKGTYIRTLSEDLATSLDLPGHMSALRRTATGPFDLGQAVTLETLIAVAETEGENSLDRFLIDPELAVDHLARVEVSHSAAFYLKQGQAVLVRNAPLSGIVRIAEADGPFLGVGVILDDGRVAPKRLFVDSH
ncbi:tRNA pseudouridine(55) synthase TruB [Luminiphilus sp.]|nr:tRNA pseudouridine(55) synthase TruB [Luminiphilus sp.]MDB2313722.1 tRNA pseudouridine(55) synthase TruB [Luminiphilus sp.]